MIPKSNFVKADEIKTKSYVEIIFQAGYVWGGTGSIKKKNEYM